MSLPSAWVDELFGRLSLAYGASFMRQYADMDERAVKADWAQRLDGMSGETIRYALENLPASPAVTALQFRAICKSRPHFPPVSLALPPPSVEPTPERMAEIRAKLRQARDRITGMA